MAYSFWHIFFGIYFDILSGIYSDTLSGMYFHILSGILSGIFSGILSGICSDIFSDFFFWQMYLAYLLTLFLAFYHYLVYLRRFFVVEVRRGTLRSSACSWGPAGITLILSLPFGPGREHCDLALAVEVRRGSLWSWACRSGPAGNTAI